MITQTDSDDDKPPTGKNGNYFPKKIGIIFSDVKRENFPSEAAYITEKDAEHDAQAIAEYINKLGIEPLFYPGNELLPERLRKEKPDMVLNLVGSVRGVDNLESAIPGVLELLNIPYTGAGILGESLSYNKFLTKKLLEQNGVPVPHYQLFNSTSDAIDPTLRFPLISKLNEIHGAVEITKDAVSENETHLRNRLRSLMTTYKQPILVEEFIAGRELTAILLEGLNTKVYLVERIFQKKPNQKYIFATFNYQWIESGPAEYQKYQDNFLKEYVKKAFEVTKMSDYAKFDIRLDNSGRYYFIDANSNPSFGPKELGTAISSILDLYGISFTDILKRLIINTKHDKGSDKITPTPNKNI
jgi:D-alanine-D-alanine ligase